MPSRKSPKKSRKRKHDQIQHGSENEEVSLDTLPHSKRRRLTKSKSPTKSKQRKHSTESSSDHSSQYEPPSTKRRSPRKSPRKRKHSKEEADSDSNSSSDHEQSEHEINIINQSQSQSQSQSQRSPRNGNKKLKPLQQKRISPQNKNKKNTNKKKSRRVSVSQSQTHSQSQRQRQRRVSVAQSQSQSQSIDVQDFTLVKHNERVMQMYNWLTKSQSWTEIKKTLQEWVKNECDSQDTENYAELTLDIINLMLYCGGVRVFKLDDIDDLDLDALTAKEKDEFAAILQEALLMDHEDIESLPEDAESDDEEDQDEHETDGHSEEEKAEEADKNKKKQKKKKKKGPGAPRTEAERVLEFDPMLWRNGTIKIQNSFKSRYGQLMQKIGQVFEESIFENDDYIISCILNWCKFFARSFNVVQFRKLATFTAFSLCDPLVRCMARNRKPMEKMVEQLEREKIAQRHNVKKRGSPRKKVKETEKMKRLKENIEEYKSKIDNLELHINDMFEKLAAYKAADNNENIRCIVLENIVKWINIDPSTDSFLRNKYWQYLLYGLQDKQSSKVRETALRQLMELFDYEHKFHGKTRHKKAKKKTMIIEETQSDKLDANRKAILEPFWDRIRETVNSLLKDKNESVVGHCIEFINILLRGDLLGADDGDCILNYMFDESDEIRRMSAKFIFYDTFDVQAVLKSHESARALSDDERDEEKHDAETRIRIKDQVKMKDDIVEIIQLMKDRVVDLNIKVHRLLDAEKERMNNGAIFKKNALYRNYVQVADYIVQSMAPQLDVLREWSILFALLRDADMNEQREKERNITNKNRNDGDDDIEEMNVKHHIDDEGQTMLCYLILSCIKSATNTLGKQCRNVKAKRGRKSQQSEEEQRLAALDRLTECVLPHLSALLDIYRADVFKLYPLIKMIYLIPIEAFDGVKNKEHLNHILNSLSAIFSRHDTPLIGNIQSMNDSSSMDEDEEGLEINDDMDDDEKAEMELKIRNKELKELRICIKEAIDNELIAEIGKSFSFLCDNSYQHKEHSGRFVFDIVTQIIDEFEDITDKIDRKLEKGEDLSTLDALMDDDDSEEVSKLNLMQSLYSNLHKQYSLKCTMDVGPIQFASAMQRLLGNIYDSLMFDGTKCQISNMLYLLLTAEISRSVVKLNFVSPDMDKLHDLTQQKEALAKVLRYYVDKMYAIIHEDNDDKKAPNTETLGILDVIASMMETLSYFKYLKHQHQLLDNTFNNASLIELEPVYGIENEGNFNEISVLKKRLLAICEYVLHLPIIEDPYDPSTHINTENIQIRYLFSCARLSIMNPSYYKQFGAVILSFYYRPNNVNKSSTKSRRDEIIKGIAHKLIEQSPEIFEEILFLGIKRIISNENIESNQVRKVIIEKIGKSVAMMKGMGVNTRKSWSIFIKLMFDFIIGDIEYIPSYFPYLHCLTFFFRHFTNRDKLEIWSYFQSLSRKLPEQNMRNDESKWNLYDQFRQKLKNEAQKAQRNRNLDLDDDDLENFDLRESQTQSQIVNIDINDSRSIDINQSGSIDVGDINMGVEIEQERVAVAVSRVNDEVKDEEEDIIGHRVSVAIPRKRISDNDDEDIDLKGLNLNVDDDGDSDDDEEERETQHTNTSSIRRGLGKKRVRSETKQIRKSPAGKWLKRKKNK